MSMKAETDLKLTYGIWGLVIGAGVAMIVGFNFGGWTTKGTSQANTDAALLAARAAICVAQFTLSPNDKQRFKDLKAINTWDRASFIEKGGWDRMPGETKAGDTVARACAEGLGPIVEK
jgi:hypothetical protein